MQKNNSFNNKELLEYINEIEEQKKKIDTQIKSTEESIIKEIDPLLSILKNEEVSENEVKKAITKYFNVSDMENISKKKISDNVDEIMIELNKNPQLSIQLQKEIEMYNASKNKISTEKIKDESFMSFSVVDFYKKILNGTNLSTIKNNVNINLYTSNEAETIKKNMEIIISELDEMYIRVGDLKKIISSIYELYNNREKYFLEDFSKNKSYMETQLMKEIKQFFNELGLEKEFETYEVFGLGSSLKQYNKLNEKWLKTTKVKQEINDMKNNFENFLVQVLTKLLIEICRKIKDCFKIVTYPYNTHVFYLDVDSEEYKIPYNDINIKALILFMHNYLSNILYYSKQMHSLKYQCDQKIGNLKEQEKQNEDETKLHFDNIQTIYKQLMGTSYYLSPSCFDELEKRIKSNLYNSSQANVDLDNVVKEVKEESKTTNLSIEELEEMKHYANKYLLQNDKEINERRRTVIM